MKTINFYKKTDKVFSVYAESLENVINNPLSYFQGYTNDMVITDVQYKYPIFINGKLREMTRAEQAENNIEIQFEDGEFIENKKLIKVPKPQGDDKYLVWNKEKRFWYLDTEKQLKDYFERIDSIKAEVLDYGFDYKVDSTEHRQRCRDKDIIWIAMTALLLFLVKTFLGKEIKKTWYFEDDYGKEMDLMGFVQLMFFGSTFIQSVYDTENYFKTKENPKELTKTEFETKRKEIHIKLANM